jgi:hypothetical protein
LPFYLCRLLRIEIANPFAWTAGEKSLSRNFNLQTLPCSRKGDGTSQSSLRVIWYSAISTVVQGVAAGEKDARERGNNRHTHQRLGYTKYQDGTADCPAAEADICPQMGNAPRWA